MERGTPRQARVENVLAVVIMIVYVMIAWQAREDTDILGSDELEYRALSQSLEQGSYRETFQVSEPWAVKYPPAFPALIVALRAVGGDHLDGVRLANIILVGVALFLCYLCVRQFAGGWLALGALMLSAYNPYTLANAGSMMSEALYFFCVSVALYAMFQAEKSQRWAVPVVILFSLLAFLTRTAGITIVVTAAVWFAMRRPRKELIVYAAIATIVVAGWFTYAAKIPHEGAASYGRDLSDANRNADAPLDVVGRTIERAVRSAFALSTRTQVHTLALPTLPDTIVDNLAWCAVLFLLVPIGLVVLWRSWRGMAIYMLLYGGLLVAWPFSNYRLFSVIIPVLFIAMLLGAASIARRLDPRVGKAGVAILIVLIMVGATLRNIDRYDIARRCDREHPNALYGCHQPVENSLIKASEYLKQHASPDDVVVTSKGASVYFLSNRKTLSARYLLRYGGAAVDTLRARGIRYVMIGKLIWYEDGGLVRELTRRCNELRVEVNDLPNGMLLSVLPPGETASEACAVIPALPISELN